MVKLGPSWPRPGDRFFFQDGDEIREGICNGETFRHESVGEEGDAAVYVPAHVPATNQNMVVDLRNLGESE